MKAAWSWFGLSAIRATYKTLTWASLSNAYFMLYVSFGVLRAHVLPSSLLNIFLCHQSHWIVTIIQIIKLTSFNNLKGEEWVACTDLLSSTQIYRFLFTVLGSTLWITQTSFNLTSACNFILKSLFSLKVYCKFLICFDLIKSEIKFVLPKRTFRSIYEVYSKNHSWLLVDYFIF